MGYNIDRYSQKFCFHLASEGSKDCMVTLYMVAIRHNGLVLSPYNSKNIVGGKCHRKTDITYIKKCVVFIFKEKGGQKWKGQFAKRNEANK